MLEVKKITFKNGLRLVFVPMDSIETVTVMVMAGGGSRYESKEVGGVAHFLEHMFFKGAKKYPDSKAVAEAIENVGGYFNAFTSYEHVNYYVKVAKLHAEKAFDVLSDMMLNSKLDAKEIEREKGVILEEYNMVHDTPTRLIWDTFFEVMYGDQPIGRAIIGTTESIKAMNRKKIVQYKTDLYQPSNMVVAIAGNISLAKATSLVKKYLPMKAGNKTLQSDTPITPTSTKPLVKLAYKSTDQAHLALGMPAISAQDARRYALGLGSSILGGSMSSRLFLAIRERRGLAYYVRTTPELLSDTGLLVTTAGVKLNAIEEALRLIKQGYQKMAKELVTSAELKKAKEYAKGGLLMSLEDSESVAHEAGAEELLMERTIRVSEIIQKINAVTPKQIRDVFAEIYSPANLRLAIVGPFKKSDADKFAKILAK